MRYLKDVANAENNVENCLSHRCMDHKEINSLNSQANGAECAICALNDSERNHKQKRIAFLEGAIEGITLYAIWKDGIQRVGCLETPLKEVLEPYHYEIKRLQKEIIESK